LPIAIGPIAILQDYKKSYLPNRQRRRWFEAICTIAAAAAESSINNEHVVVRNVKEVNQYASYRLRRCAPDRTAAHVSGRRNPDARLPNHVWTPLQKTDKLENRRPED